MAKRSLEVGTKLYNGRYVIQAKLCPGVDCLTYLANEGCSIIKEYYPDWAVRNEDDSLSECGNTSEFKELANLHRCITDTVIGINSIGTYDMFEENNTVYFVYNFPENIRADFVSKKDGSYGKAVFQNSYYGYIEANKDKMTLYDVIYPIWLAAHILYEYHANGYVHTNLKPEKLLVSTSEDGRPVAVQVLETGSMVREGRNDGQFIITKGWSDPGIKDMCFSPLDLSSINIGIDGRSDIFSLGRILFKIIEPTTIDDFGHLIDRACFSFEKSECDCIVFADEENKKMLKKIIRHSMILYPRRRYHTAIQFADALAGIIMDLPETDLDAFREEERKMHEWHISMRKKD